MNFDNMDDSDSLEVNVHVVKPFHIPMSPELCSEAKFHFSQAREELRQRLEQERLARKKQEEREKMEREEMVRLLF